MEVTKEFRDLYEKRGEHRRRCRVCGKLIQDGEMTVFRQIKTKEYYAVRGTMGFTNWYVAHDECDKHKDEPMDDPRPKSVLEETMDKVENGELTIEEAVRELRD